MTSAGSSPVEGHDLGADDREATVVETSTLRRWWASIAAIAIALPVFAALIALFRPQWFPAGDMAQAELHVRALWADPPLTGAAGRIQSASGVQGSHPGPSLWIAMYPVYLLLGRSSFGIMAAAASIHVAAIVASLVVARRRGGWGLMVIVGSACLLVTRSAGPVFWTEPWNPWLAVFPFLLFVLLIWSVVEGDLLLVPFAVLVGSHCIQSHIGYAVLVAGLLGVGLVAVATRAFRAPETRIRSWTAIGAAAAAGLMIWLPPLVDQARNDPGNLRIIYENFTNPNGALISMVDTMRVAADQLDVLGPWLTGRTRVDPSWIGCFVVLAAWAAVAWNARRRRAWPEVRLHGVLAITVLLGTVSTSRLFGTFFEYTVRWWWAITALVVAAILHSAWRWVQTAQPTLVAARQPAFRIATALIVVLLVGVTTIQFADRAKTPGAAESVVIGGLAPQLRSALNTDERYLLRWIDPRTLGAIAFGIVLEMERDDIQVLLGTGFSAGVMPHRVAEQDQVGAVLYLVLGPQAERLASDPSVDVIAAFDPRTAKERTQTNDLTVALDAALTESGRPDLIDLLDDNNGLARIGYGMETVTPEVLDLADQLSALPQPAAVVLLAPGQSLPGQPLPG